MESTFTALVSNHWFVVYEYKFQIKDTFKMFAFTIFYIYVRCQVEAKF